MPLTKIKSENIDATGNLSLDTGTLFIDSVNDRVGIGNTAPVNKLSVNGTTYLSGNTTIAGFANVSSNINAASFNVGATQFANTTGVYATFMNSKTEGNLNVNNATYSTTLNITALGGSVDLNTLTSTAVYHQGSNVNAASGTNYPVAAAGLLEVYAISVMIYQRYTVYNTGEIYTRSYYNGTWYAWHLVLDSGNYNSYSPTLTGTGASGNWNITANNASYLGTIAAANYARTDVDDTFAGNLTLTSGANAVLLTNATSNWMYWNTSGVAAPTTTTRSNGTKLILYPSIGASAVDYAIGIESGHMWFSTASSSTGFKWYSGTTNFMTANNNGLTMNGKAITMSGSGAQISGRAGDGASAPTYTWGGYESTTGMYLGSGGELAFATSGTHAGRFDVSGQWLVGTTSAFALTSAGTGAQLRSEGSARFYIDSECPLELSRQTNDGVMTRYRRDGALVAQITVASGVLTYGTFTGSHIATLNERNEFYIPVGTILEVDDDFTVWKQVKFEDEGGVLRKVAYTGEAAIGSVISYEYRGVTYQAEVIEEGQEGYLKKDVTVKISDTPESKNVYGVFAHWDNYPTDEDEYWYGDMIIASIGTYVIRISGDYEVEKGDLIVSNGDGTGKPQSDDIVRSKTVAKVINATKQVVYDDGSYLVACSLHCG